MALLQPLFMQAATGDTAIQETAQQYRALIDAIATYPGVMLSGDLKVTQRGAGANMSVDVAAGTVFVRGTSVAYQGSYMCQSTATVNVPIASAPGSGSRTDLIVAQVYDKQSDGGSQYSWTPFAVTGTVGAGTPAAPASSVPLATVTVASGVASIVNANITDARLFASSFSSVAVASSFSTLPANPRQGDQGYTNDTSEHFIYNGSAGRWDRYSPSYLGVAQVNTTSTGGVATIPLPPNLGYTPSVILVGLQDINPSGAGTPAASVKLITGSITSTQFKVLVLNIAGSGYAATCGVTYLLRP